jgi:hypothetical protein
MNTRENLSAGIFMVACMASCTDSRGDATYTLTDSMGIAIIESHTPAWGSSPPRIDSVPLLQIGSEEPGPYQFAYVLDGLLSAGGEIVVVEASANEIRVFSSAGEHAATYGRQGDGPGEFRALFAVLEHRGDSLLALDGRLRRVTIFPTSSAGPPRVFEGQYEGNFAVFGAAEDSLLLLFSPGSGMRRDLSPGRQWIITDILAMSTHDGQVDTIAKLPDRERVVATDGNAPMIVPMRYAIHATSRDGFYWATPDRYEIGFRGPDGSLRRLLRRPVQPRPVEPPMIAQYIDGQVEGVLRARGEEAAAATRQRYQSDPYGDEIPLFSSAFVDRDQRLWVSESSWPSEDIPTGWSVFSPEGVWLGDLEAPRRVRLLDARGDTVLGIWHDELDVQHVQLHGLLWPRAIIR